MWLLGFGTNAGVDNISVASISAGKQKWSKLHTLAKGTNVSGIGLSGDVNGNLLARWQQEDQNGHRVFHAFYKPQGLNKWLKTVFPAVTSCGYSSDQVTVDAQGNSLLIWQRSAEPSIFSSMTLPHGSLRWSQSTDFPYGDQMNYPLCAIDKKGNRILVWNDRKNWNLEYALLPHNSKAWTPPITISGFSGSLYQVALRNNEALIMLENDFELQSITGTALFY